MPEPILYEQREPRSFDNANPVEVVVAAVLLGCVRMQRQRPLQAQLPVDDLGDSRRRVHRALLPLEVPHQKVQRGGSVQRFHRQQISLGPDRITNHQHSLRGEAGDRVPFRDPVGAAVDSAVVQYQVSVIGQSKRRQREAARGAQFERPPGQGALKVRIDERMLDPVPGAVRLENSLHNGMFG